MANTNVTRIGEFAQKKTVSQMVVQLNAAVAAEFAAAGNYLVGNLPPEAVITAAYVHTITTSNAGAITVGTAEAGTEILSAGDSATPGKTGTFTGQSATITGMPVFIATAGAVTEANIGDFIVVVEYVEYTKNTGEYTRFS